MTFRQRLLAVFADYTTEPSGWERYRELWVR